MKVSALLAVCVITGCSVSMADSFIPIVEFITDIAKFSLSLYEFIDGFDKEKDITDSIAQLSGKISSTKEMLYQKLLIQSQLNKIEETRLEIHSSLLDLKRCLTVRSSERLEYRNLFLTRADRAIPRIRFLATHLSDDAPGNSKSLIQMVVEASRCNLSAFDVLQVESMDLLSNGILIEITLMRMLGNFTLEKETKFWENEVERVLTHFKSQHNICLARRHTFVVEDIMSSSSALQLQKDNMKRYQWAWNDVFQIPTQLPKPLRHYRVHKQKVFITHNDAMINIITYGGHMQSRIDFTENDLRKVVTQSVIPGKDDAEDIETKVRTALIKSGVGFSAIIVFFNGQGLKPDIAIDTDTQALRVDTTPSTLKYCSSVFCKVNWDDWLGIDDRESGHFTVYVVLDYTENVGPHHHVVPHDDVGSLDDNVGSRDNVGSHHNVGSRHHHNQNYDFVYDDAVASANTSFVLLICTILVQTW